MHSQASRAFRDAVAAGRLRQWSHALFTSAQWLLRGSSLLNLLRHEKRANYDKVCQTPRLHCIIICNKDPAITLASRSCDKPSACHAQGSLHCPSSQEPGRQSTFITECQTSGTDCTSNRLTHPAGAVSASRTPVGRRPHVPAPQATATMLRAATGCLGLAGVTLRHAVAPEPSKCVVACMLDADLYACMAPCRKYVAKH